MSKERKTVAMLLDNGYQYLESWADRTFLTKDGSVTVVIRNGTTRNPTKKEREQIYA